MIQIDGVQESIGRFQEGQTIVKLAPCTEVLRIGGVDLRRVRIIVSRGRMRLRPNSRLRGCRGE
jgi:hypothetical protein